MTWTANLDSFKRVAGGTDTVAQVTFTNGADAFTETITLDCMNAATLADAVANKLAAYQEQEDGFNTLAAGPITPGVGATERRLRNALKVVSQAMRDRGQPVGEVDQVLLETEPRPQAPMAKSVDAKANALASQNAQDAQNRLSTFNQQSQI